MSRAVHPSTLATFRLPIASLPDADRALGLPCPVCSLALDLYQPDTDDPDFLLGSCPACGAWHLVEMDSDQIGAVIVSLPGGDAIRAALKAGC